MLKKIIICILTIVLAMSSTAFIFAAEENLVIESRNDGENLLRYVSIVKAEYNLTFTGSTAKARIYVTPKSGATVDHIVLNGKLMRVGSSTPVKTWEKTVYPDTLGDFIWSSTQKVTVSGTYYFSGEIKCYNGSNLLETISGESLQVQY